MSEQDIYQEILLEHNVHPHHFEVMPNASHQAYGNNPLCGDELTIFVKLEEGKIKALSFKGEGCAICKASGSLMTSALEGLTLDMASHKAKDFIQLLSDHNPSVPNDLGELEALLGVRKFPARLKCATLAWHTFLKAIEADQ